MRLFLVAPRFPALLLGASLAACGEAPKPAPATAAPAAVAGPADSLVLTLADSTTVWMVRGRDAVSPDGTPCHEHSLELRKGPRKLLVPLLYTRAAPRLDGGKLYATLSNRCADVAEYAIDPATAYPTPRGPR